MRLLAKLVQSLRDVGIRRTAVRVVEGLAWRTAPIREWPKAQIRRIRLVADAQFDRKYGVDTGGAIGVNQLDFSDDQKKSGFWRYEATPESAIRGILKALPIRHEEFTFIDCGSGKGRVLLLASEYPYKRIVGVEASRQLNDIAVANFKTWKSPRQRSFQLESVCIDAREYYWPEDPLVIFFFTPFERPTSDQVIDRIRRSLQANPRPICIVHYGTNEEFRQILSTLNVKRTTIYSSKPFSAPHRYVGVLFTNLQ